MSAKQVRAQAGCVRVPAVALVAALAVALALLQAADAKRGCMAFGHSCFGGHGKRADMEPGAEGAVAASAPEEAASAAVAEAAQALLEDQLAAAAPQRFRLSPFLRQWLQRAYQQQSADSNTVEVK